MYPILLTSSSLYINAIAIVKIKGKVHKYTASNAWWSIYVYKLQEIWALLIEFQQILVP
jgi:hypothetical protein